MSYGHAQHTTGSGPAEAAGAARRPGRPGKQGLYDPGYEHDACGVAFVVDATGRRTHTIIEHGLTALHNLDHRGAAGAEPSSGDGAGILLQLPDAFLRAVVDFALPEVAADGASRYAAGLVFMPEGDGARAELERTIVTIAAGCGVTVLGWRDVPIRPDGVGPTARSTMPAFAHVFIAGTEGESGLDLERLAYRLRKRIEHETGTYVVSLSSRTLVYKGMLTTDQLGAFFPDLGDERLESAIALVHSRFSTNTFP
ncbi:MAG: hypothetical protein ACR2F6_13560, partial [Mycobacteriales bacterium]